MSLLHGGANSRTRQWTLTLEDMILFAYICPHFLGDTRNKNGGSNDGIQQEEGDSVYRLGIYDRVCKHMYRHNGRCSHCIDDVITETIRSTRKFMCVW